MFYIATYKKPSAKKALRRASKAEVPTIQETSDKAADVLRSASHAVMEAVSEDKCTPKKL